MVESDGIIPWKKGALLCSQWQGKRQWAHIETQEFPLTTRKLLLWEWSRTGTGCQWGCGVPTIRAVQKMPGQGPGQPALGEYAWAVVGVGPNDLQRSHSNSTSMGLCDRYAKIHLKEERHSTIFPLFLLFLFLPKIAEQCIFKWNLIQEIQQN